MENKINIYFNDYKNQYDKYLEIMESDIFRSLRVFDIRMRLSLDITVTFNGSISYTKTKGVRDTYSLIFNLLEVFFSLEALRHCGHEMGYNSNNGPIQSFSLELIKNAQLNDDIKYYSEKLKSLCKSKSFYNNMNQYLNRFINDQRIKSNIIKENIRNIITYLETKDFELSGREFIALAYAERNMYVHNGETARMGMNNYNHRKEILNILYEYISIFTLKIITYILKNEISKNG
ncbi:MAG: hypothetical protein QHH74_05745 [Spirochaetota bacterium]|nr:hypothetical protein [Spirochaetota bacterium]